MAKPLPREARVEKESQAWSLRSKGWTEARIGEALGLSQPTVSRYLKRTSNRVLRDLDATARHELVVSIAQLNYVKDEALQAWERSKKPKKKASKRTGAKSSKGEGGAGATDESQTTEVVERDGDVAYLATFYAAVDRLSRLLHLESHVRPTPDDDASGVTLARALLIAEQVDAELDAADRQPPALEGPTADDEGTEP